MPLPTLLIKKNLVASKFSPPQDELDKYIPIDYIMQWFNDKIPPSYGEQPHKKAESPADKILILRSSTGSGKSTAFISELYYRFQERTNKHIACTQPRVLTAIDISKNTIPPVNTKEELIKRGKANREALIFGKNIGVQTGFFSKKPIKGIIFTTPGIITAQLSIMTMKEFENMYSFIVIDEAHERSLQIDTLLFLLKQYISLNFRTSPFLVVMSATFDVEKFADYLLSDLPKDVRYKNIIDVKGFTYPVEEHFLKYDSNNYLTTIVDKVIEIHKNNELDFIPVKEIMKNKKIYSLEDDMKESDIAKSQTFRDILIFIKGPGEITKIKDKINKLNDSNEYFSKYPVLPLGITSETVSSQGEDYKNAIERGIDSLTIEIDTKKGKITKKPVRRVMIATNVAETGLTVNTLRYVIDSGFVFSNEFNPCFGCDQMISKPITQGMHKQRRGRVGRLATGSCYSIFTQKSFDLLQVDQYPDIIKNEITLDLLNMIIRIVDKENELNESTIFKLFSRKDVSIKTAFEEKIHKAVVDIYNIDLLDSPSVDSLHYSIEKLYTLGAIDSNSIPTVIGFIMNKFRFIRIESIRMILAGYAWNVSIIDLITMACFLESKNSVVGDEEKFNEVRSRNGKFTFFANEQHKVISYSEYKTELFISDDFMRFLLIFQEFKEIISKVNIQNLEAIKKIGDRKKRKEMSNKNIIEILENWSKENGINLRTMLNIIELRDSVISCMAMIGLSPFANNENSLEYMVNFDDVEKFEYICKVKRCIYEGYKNNIAIWDYNKKKYYSRKSHLFLTIKSSLIQKLTEISKYGDNNPKYIIFSNNMLFLSNKTNLYESKVSHICILDGFISIDPNFDCLF